MSDSVVIVSCARTPLGAFLGSLSSASSPELGAAVLKASVDRAGADISLIEEVIMGCVLPAGLGQAPARQAALKAGLSMSAPAVTVNKVCGSGMQSIIFAADRIMAGSASCILAGGMESMSNAPYLLQKIRKGVRMGHQKMLDHMMLDGLEDAYNNKGTPMGSFAEDCASEYGFGRDQQDAFALSSLERAKLAIENGWFVPEIVPVEVSEGRTSKTIDQDESPLQARPEKIPMLKPAFREGGTVTAVNASSISDGAAALMLMRRKAAEEADLEPLAVVRGHAVFADDPARFTTAPIGAMRLLAQKTGWDLANVDLFEINEAFAVVPMAAMQTLNIPSEKVNIHGGACALGHPIGASGARIVVTLLSALKRTNQRRGIASACIGGGEATAIAVEIAA